jgi:hypothetical protein
MYQGLKKLCSFAVMQFCSFTIPQAPFLGGRALKNDPVDHFSEGAKLQGRFVVVGLGVCKDYKEVLRLCSYSHSVTYVTCLSSSFAADL